MLVEDFLFIELLTFKSYLLLVLFCIYFLRKSCSFFGTNGDYFCSSAKSSSISASWIIFRIEFTRCVRWKFWSANPRSSKRSSSSLSSSETNISTYPKSDPCLWNCFASPKEAGRLCLLDLKAALAVLKGCLLIAEVDLSWSNISVSYLPIETLVWPRVFEALERVRRTF